MKIKIVNQSKHPLPEYETELSAGMDLRANLEEPVLLQSLERALIPTGLFIELPAGYEAQIRPRSGLAIKKGISLVNTPGTIDADYRGEIKIILINLSKEDFLVNDGERIAQMVISRHEKAEFVLVEELNETDRGAGGFGHHRQRRDHRIGDGVARLDEHRPAAADPAHHLDAVLFQLLGNIRRIAVHQRAGTDFITCCQNFRFHFTAFSIDLASDHL